MEAGSDSWDVGRSLESLSTEHNEATLLLLQALAAFPSWVSQVSFWSYLLHIPISSCPLLCPHPDFHLMRLFPSLHSSSLLADLEYNHCDIPEETWTGQENEVAYASYIPGSISSVASILGRNPWKWQSELR